MRHAAVVVVLLTATAVGMAADRTETMAEGFHLSSDLWMAGDISFEAEVPETGPAAARLGDLSLLARWEPTTRVALFAELRTEDMIELREGDGANLGGEVALERAYLEALLTPTVSVRLGRVFTPFGLWNVIRRAPLTWTVERPAATEDMFPEHATGLSVLHQTTWRGWMFDTTVYGPLQDEPALQHSDEKGWLLGSRLAAGRDLAGAFAVAGVSAAGFQRRDGGPWTTAAGLDLEVAIDGHQLTGELVFRLPSSGGATVHGLYLQDVIPLAPILPPVRDFFGVLRFELFQPGHGRTAVGNVVGLLWRPLPRLVAWANYLFSTRTLSRLEPGFNGSLSFLF